MAFYSMYNRNQYYQLIITLMFFSTIIYVQNLVAAGNSYTEQEVINIYTDTNEFEIKLKSNPTTGYSWYLENYNSNLLTPIKQEYKSSQAKKNSKPLLGAGGTDTWTFKATKEAFTVPRVTEIAFTYMRPWTTKTNVKDTNDANNLDISDDADSINIKIIINPGKKPIITTDD